MAVTTTTTHADAILAELINERKRQASYANVVVLPHCSMDSIFGAPALAKAYPIWSDLGAASAASEGSTISNTTASLGTQAIATPTEGAAQRFDVTYRTIRRSVPGVGQVRSILQSGQLGPVLNVFADFFMQQTKSVMEKIEVDANALTAGFSGSVGSTGVNLSVANMEAALLALANNDTGREQDWVFILAPQQIADLRAELSAGSGASLANIFSTNVQDIVTVKPDLPQNGLQGSFYGVPVYQSATSTNPDPNMGADLAGCLMVSGAGQHPDDQEGALLYLEGEPMHHNFDDDPSERHVELYTIAEYAVTELRDSFGISIITDA